MINISIKKFKLNNFRFLKQYKNNLTNSSKSSSPSSPPPKTPSPPLSSSTSSSKSSTTIISKKKSYLPFYLAAASVTGVFALFFEDYVNTPNGILSKLLNKPGFIMSFSDSINESFSEVLEPSSTELLPTWPIAPCYEQLGIPPGTPAPPLLVIDLEKTLIASEHDPRYGWRHVKRPGATQFIEALSNYYEIVIFSENDVGMVENVLMALDKDGRTHKLGPAACEQHENNLLKRLDCMNRDLRRIILIDDSPISSQKFPRNTILVKPFEDVRSRDTILLDLIPVLQAFIHQDGIKDFRNVLDDLGTHEAEEIVTEYHLRVAQAKVNEESKKNRGLGKFIRDNAGINTSPDLLISSSKPTMSEIVGVSEKQVSEEAAKVEKEFLESKAAANKKRGLLYDMFERNENQRMEIQAKKREIMENMYREKMMEKMKNSRNNQSDFENDDNNH